MTTPIGNPKHPQVPAGQNLVPSPSAGEASAAGPRRSADLHASASIPNWKKLAALAARLATLPQRGHAFVSSLPPRLNQSPHPSGVSRLSFVESPFLRVPGRSQQNLGFLPGNLAAKKDGDPGAAENFDDFDGLWVGGVPDSSAFSPGGFLDKFKNSRSGEFDEAALKIFGIAQKLESGLQTLKSAGRTTSEEYRSKLNDLGVVGVDLLRMICEIPPDQRDVPAVSQVSHSFLALLDGFFKSSGSSLGRRSYLQAVDKTFADAGDRVAVGSAPGAMLADLSQAIQREVFGATNSLVQTPATGVAMQSALMPILDRCLRMHEKQAVLEALSGNHAQATLLLEKCVQTLTAQKILDPQGVSGKPVELYFNILNSQISARDEEAVGTLEVLYMAMLSYAKEHEDRFPASFPQPLFIANLEDAYSAFLDELDDGDAAVSLEHPIAKLFLAAQSQGVFDDSERAR